MPNQVTLFLMNRKGLAVLAAVIARYGPEAVSRVVTAADPAVERDYCCDIQRLAAKHGIPASERTQADPPRRDEVCLAAGWRWLIRDAGRLVVIHDSLLPRYRGFAPLVSSLINGEPRIGATALLAAERYDEGDVLAQGSIDVTYPIKVAEAIELLAPVYVDLAGDVVGRIVTGEPLQGRAQDDADASYSLWRDEDDYRIDWTKPARWIRRMIDAVGFPYRGASAVIDDRLVRILEAEECPELTVENRTEGKVIFLEEGCPVVVCGQGLLVIKRLLDDATRTSLLPLRRFRTRLR